MSTDRVRLDINYCLDTQVGTEKGLSVKDIEAFAARLSEVHKELEEERRAGHHSYRDLPYDTQASREVADFAREARGRFRDYVHIGIGGSSLGSRTLVDALSHPFHNMLDRDARGGAPRIFFAENPDPSVLDGLLGLLDLPNTLVNVVTKSGSTAESIANFLVIFEALRDRVPADKLGEHVVVTTDPDSGDLRRLAEREGWRRFSIPRGVGGRFSALTPVGLLPAALAGIDTGEILVGAGQMENLCAQNASPFANPAYAFALVHYLMDELKDVRLNVLMPYSDRLSSLADWFRQLWAESLGKKHSLSGDTVHVGPTPIRSVGTVDQHSQVQLYVEGPSDKLITFVEIEALPEKPHVPAHFADVDAFAYLGGHPLARLLSVEKQATEYALTRSQRANITVIMPGLDARSMGQILMMLESATTVAGKLYEVSAYDQPGVEEGKLATYALMGRKTHAERRHEYLNRFPKQPRFVI